MINADDFDYMLYVCNREVNNLLLDIKYDYVSLNCKNMIIYNIFNPSDFLKSPFILFNNIHNYKNHLQLKFNEKIINDLIFLTLYIFIMFMTSLISIIPFFGPVISTYLQISLFCRFINYHLKFATM